MRNWITDLLMGSLPDEPLSIVFKTLKPSVWHLKCRQIGLLNNQMDVFKCFSNQNLLSLI